MISFLVIVSAFIAVKSSPVIENEDFFVDQVLNVTRNKYMTELEPFHIMDFTASYSFDHGGMAYNVSVICTEIYASGLSYVTRHESCTKGKTTDQFIAHLSFGDDNLKLKSKVLVDFNGFKANVSVVVDISNFIVNITVGKDTEGKAKVLDVMTDGITHAVFHFGYPFDEYESLINSKEEVMLKAGNPHIKDMAQQLVTEVFGKAIKQYNYPKQ